MKTIKATILAVVLLISVQAEAQLKVNSNGRAIVGKHSTGYTTAGNAELLIYSPGNIPSVTIFPEAVSGYTDIFKVGSYQPNAFVFSGYTINSSTNVWTRNLTIRANGYIGTVGDITSDGQVAGKQLRGQSTNINDVLFTGLYNNLSTGKWHHNFNVTAGGSVDATFLKLFNSNSTGNFLEAYYVNPSGGWETKFVVKTNGNIYYTGGWMTSDERTKTDIAPITSALNKVLRLKGVSYKSQSDLNNEDYEKMMTEASSRTTSNKSADDTIRSEQPDVTMETARAMYQEKDRKHIGLLAQDVEKVVPEVVRTTPDGMKAISYQELVGLLVEAIKEQQEQIEDLKLQLSPTVSKQKIGATTDTATDTATDISSIVVTGSELYQNIPNPFSDITEIKYYLSDNVSKASIYIYDMQGRQIKNIPILQNGSGSITISGYELSPGMYIYTLIADGKEVNTKRMILTD